jgi:hypothetical protein
MKVSKTTKTDEVCTFMIEVFDFESSLGEIMYTTIHHVQQQQKNTMCIPYVLVLILQA